MHDDVQPNYVVDSYADYTSDSNMIPYDQYVKDNAVPVVQSNVSYVPNDAYMMIYNDMYEPHAQSVSKTTQNTVVDNSLTAELATYKKQVELYERRSQDIIKMKAKALKEQTTASRPTKALTVYLPNTPATLFPRVLPTKKNFEAIQKALTKEVKEMKEIFEELEAEVYQHVVDRKHDEIERKNLLIANDNLIPDCLFKDVFHVATNSELVELSDLRDKIQKDNHDELIKRFSNLEVNHLNLQTLDVQITQLTKKINVLQEQNELFRAENGKIKQHYKELYDSIKITRAKHLKQTSALLTDNESLKVEIQNKLSCVNKDHVKPKVLALGNNTHKPVALNCQKTNVPVPPSTGVNSCTDASGSQHRSNTKKNRILPTKSVNMKKVEEHPRTIKSYRRPLLDSGMTILVLSWVMRYYVIGESVISSVYYVEGLGHNMFFIGQFCDSDLEVAFRKHSCYPQEQINGCASAFIPLNSVPSMDLARKRFSSSLPRLKFEKVSLSRRQLGKSKIHAINIKNCKTTNLVILNTLYMDLCDMRVQTIMGRTALVIVMSIRVYCGYVFEIQRCDPEVVTNFLKQIQVGLNKTVRNIRIDNGTEFVNKDLTDYYERVGIFHQKIVSKTPQQNSVVERRNRTLDEAARTMLIFSKALKFLWAEVVATASKILKNYTKADIGIFVLTEQMAPVQLSTGPAPTFLTPGQISSGLALHNLQAYIKALPADLTLWKTILFKPESPSCLSTLHHLEGNKGMITRGSVGSQGIDKMGTLTLRNPLHWLPYRGYSIFIDNAPEMNGLISDGCQNSITLMAS
ncbi:retrovirus-related pol polyprotein from transposon TNT 1-94 [Tanacetum coccineum]